MTMALWCKDCKQTVNLDLHGNCEHCGNPEVSLVDPLTFWQKVVQMKESWWLPVAAVSIALFGVGFAIVRFRHSVSARAQPQTHSAS